MYWIMTFPKFICWNAKSQYLSMKHCFEIGLREVIKLSEVIKVALTQYDWCPYKWGKFVHRETCRGRTMWRDIVGKWPWQAKREPGTDSSHTALAAAAAKSLQSCPTLCDPIDGSPPGSPVPGILQARTLVWAAISFSNAWKWKVKVKSLSHVRLLATPWAAAYQAPLSMGFSRQEYWSGMPFEGTNSKTPCSWNSGLQNCEKIISFV